MDRDVMIRVPRERFPAMHHLGQIGEVSISAATGQWALNLVDTLGINTSIMVE